MEILKGIRDRLGSMWIIGGDFNDIISNKEKKGGGRRPESNFTDFRYFIADMDMGDIKYKGEPFTWANNRKGTVLSRRGYIGFLDL